MENSYALLKKHFQQESSVEEEKLISEFKKENPQEYLVLKNLWQSKTKIDIKDFDSIKAWQHILQNPRTKQAKPNHLYTFRQVAAVAVIVIVGSLFAYYVTQKFEFKPTIIELATHASETDSILLADGTTVWLNRNSKLYYPKKFKGKNRTVKLEGEAWFEVTKNAKKPFTVECNYSTITVLGTTLNIDTESLATEVCLATGKVNIQSNFTDTFVDLLPNNKAIASSTNLVKTQITNPNYLSWKTGVFLFEDTPLSAVINDLNCYYNKPIVLNTNKADMLFSAQFENSNQEDILEILKLTFNLTIQETTNSYEIH
jgi:transmembrane sensor